MKKNSYLAACLAVMLAACGGGSGDGGGGVVGDTSAPAGSNLAISAQVAEAAVPSGGTAHLTITVSNAGPATARGIEVSADWGPGIDSDPDFQCAAAGGATCPAAEASGTVPDMPSGGRLTFTAPVTITSGARGAIASGLFVDATNERSPADNQAIAVIQAYRADVSVTGRGPAMPVQAGTSTSYTMTVFNAGPDEALGVQIRDTVGAGQVMGAIGCSASGGANCPAALGSSMQVPRLPANASLVFTVPVQVDASRSGTIANTMVVESAGDLVPADNSATVQGATYAANLAGQTTITLQSDPRDFVGGGRSYAYDGSNAVLSFTPGAATLRVAVNGDESWTGEFDLPNTLTQFQAGTYANLTRAPFRDPAVGGVEWSGQGRGCNTLAGSITVNSATYSTGGVLSALDLTFEQRCDGLVDALRGHVVWVASDTTVPPGPVLPVPGTLWMPPGGATPNGSYVYLQSDAGDYVGGGRTATYTKADAVLNVTVTGGHVYVGVGGDRNWAGDFATMNALAQVQPGYYGDLRRFPFHNPVKGGLNWSGDGRGCNELTGWFAVDGITWNGSSLATLDLRFEQHCEGATPSLHGQVHWDASDTTTPPGPVLPIPSALWSPAAGSTPASGNYIHLDSQPGDYIGQGQVTTLTSFSVYPDAGRISVSGGGWTGTFQAMTPLSQLQPGYYANLSRYPFHNTTVGGLDWSGNGRGCNVLQGWFAVDSASYDAGGLAAIDLRFEQHCDGLTPALRGQMHWVR